MSTSIGRTGMDRRFSIVPLSRSRVIASAVIMTIVMVRTTPIRPGTNIELRNNFRIVECVNTQIDGAVGSGEKCERAFEIVL